jgi:hypothetical protein
MVHRFFKIFSVDRRFRYSVAVNETGEASRPQGMP